MSTLASCRSIARLVLPIALFTVAACTTVPERSGLLTDYSRQAAFDGRLSKRAAARPEVPLPAGAPLVLETVVYAPGVEADSGLAQASLDVVRNRLARDLCTTLADAFSISEDAAAGQYRLRAFITEIRPTGRMAAAVSMPLSYLSPVGGRLPLGLGALSVEVELLGPDGVQVASMVWRRAASAADSATVSPVSDAYALAGEAAESFGQVVARDGEGAAGLARASGLIPDLNLGRPGPECARYGQGPGLAVSALSMFAVDLPPEWTDRGAVRTGEVTVSDPVDDAGAETQEPTPPGPDAREGPR